MASGKKRPLTQSEGGAGERPRLLTGLQPSGQLHIGNYFGALKPFLEAYTGYESFLMVADYHALTTLKKPEELEKHTLNAVLDYLGAGMDPAKVIIFRQSEVKQHTELAWIFECLVTVPFLMQAHAYKDKVAKGIEPNAGLFNYPMLMAADILLYDTEIVPVGQDQRQHIEYAREAAAKFNNTYGNTFKEPKELILDSIAAVLGTDGQKMSKSYKNTIPLFGTEEEIHKAVMGIVTDSSGDRPENVYAIHRLFKTDSELTIIYDSNKGNYKKLKEILATDIEAVVAPMRKRRETYANDMPTVRAILKKGKEKTEKIAEIKMKTVRTKIGLGPL